MKPSHLAAIMLAGISGGLVGSAPAQTQLAITNTAAASIKHAVTQRTEAQIIFEAANRTYYGIESHPCSWRKLNQRQIRLNRRRANAAGCNRAFK